MRYSEWWYTEFPKQFRARGFDVKVLGEKYINLHKGVPHDPEIFSPVKQAIELETEQIQEYMSIKIHDDDILFLSDISFPGLFCNVLYHKECPKMYAFCHATSFNRGDYFVSVRYSKFPVECAHSQLFDTIFVGSEYHQEKLTAAPWQTGIYWHNTKVTYLPFPSIDKLEMNVPGKTIDIMSASRPSPQKVDSKLEEYVEKELGVKIQRPVSGTWFNYFWNLNTAKVLLITSYEDTFGYQIVDAIMNNCIPIARNSLAYPELLPREYLYDNKEELVKKLDYILNQETYGPSVPVPSLLCEKQMNKFYDVICEEMKNG
jgi:hypothetical protein